SKDWGFLTSGVWSLNQGNESQSGVRLIFKTGLFTDHLKKPRSKGWGFLTSGVWSFNQGNESQSGVRLIFKTGLFTGHLNKPQSKDHSLYSMFDSLLTPISLSQ
ncbi:hypothetical protein, partial [Vibrio sp. V24_P1S3T111]|uniref:hypothetical protein n=1 Tax=Vibrio sp. V24_P1S3T111 TaxID=1938676 RepID=UPI001F48C8D2